MFEAGMQQEQRERRDQAVATAAAGAAALNWWSPIVSTRKHARQTDVVQLLILIFIAKVEFS